MVVTSFVCIILTLCEVVYLCGKRFRECCRGGFRPVNGNTFTMTRTPLSGKEGCACREPGPEKAADANKESSAPPYSITVS